MRHFRQAAHHQVREDWDVSAGALAGIAGNSRRSRTRPQGATTNGSDVFQRAAVAALGAKGGTALFIVGGSSMYFIYCNLDKTMSPTKKRVFISYSQDSDDHSDNVFELSESLRIKAAALVVSDHIIKAGHPPQGWPRWMTEEICNADIVLVICSENYYRRAEGKEEAGTGKGAKWEGAIITQAIYDDDSNNTKFTPVLFSQKPEQNLSKEEKDNLVKYIPTCLRSTSRYILNISDLDSCKNYENLLRHITDQPEYVASPIADKPIDLPPRNKKK